jgi:hypothetical protein
MAVAAAPLKKSLRDGLFFSGSTDYLLFAGISFSAEIRYSPARQDYSGFLHD